jgi:EAL domain-containing protein (putative c-di-GMP-specific phosphodiesterase class I)
MSKLKPAGCSFVVAGFDGAEDSLAGLRYLKPHFVKISTRLVRGLRPDTPSAAALRFINATCQSLDIATIAEQVETAEAIGEITRIGIDYVQGFGIAHPKPVY